LLRHAGRNGVTAASLPAYLSPPLRYVYRPADGNETSACYALAMLHTTAPAILALSRQNLPQLVGSSVEAAMKGAYVAFDTSDAAGGAAGAAAGKPDLQVVATGSEVSIAMEGAKKLAASTGKRIAVISAPCLEVFEKQAPEYKRSVIVEGVPTLTVEAAAVKGWERYGHAWIGMTTFGHSGPYLEVYKKLGITAEAVATKGGRMLEYFAPTAGHAVPTLPLHAPEF